MMDTQRLICFFVFSLLAADAVGGVGEGRTGPSRRSVAAEHGAAVPASRRGGADGRRQPASCDARRPPAIVPRAAARRGARARRCVVRTDLVRRRDRHAGRRHSSALELLRHKEADDSTKHSDAAGARASLRGAKRADRATAVPNHRTLYDACSRAARRLRRGQGHAGGAAQRAEARTASTVTKTYRFQRDSYVIDVALRDHATRRDKPIAPFAYFQFTARRQLRRQQRTRSRTTVRRRRRFIGSAVYTEETNSEGAAFKDIDKGKADYPKQANDGWIAIVQHYFVVRAGCRRPRLAARVRHARSVADGLYTGRRADRRRARSRRARSATVDVPLYVGPQEKDRLEAVAPGFDLVVDYGWLTIIAAPLFWLLRSIHGAERATGAGAIILLTILDQGSCSSRCRAASYSRWRR